PELRQEIGRDWVELYDGDIEAADVAAFANRLRQSRAGVADLSRYEWDDIGMEIGAFLDQLAGQPCRSCSEPPAPIANGNEPRPAAARRSYAGARKPWR